MNEVCLLAGGNNMVIRGCSSHEAEDFCIDLAPVSATFRHTICLFVCHRNSCNNQSAARIRMLQKLYRTG